MSHGTRGHAWFLAFCVVSGLALGAPVTAAHADPVPGLAAGDVAGKTELDLRGRDGGAALARALAALPEASTLVSIDLGKTKLGDDGVRALAESPHSRRSSRCGSTTATSARRESARWSARSTCRGSSRSICRATRSPTPA